MSAERLIALSLATLIACGSPSSTPVAAASDRVDAHVHLVEGATEELLAALDRQGIAAAVVIASPHLDPR